jgi:hypothetical protein
MAGAQRGADRTHLEVTVIASAARQSMLTSAQCLALQRFLAAMDCHPCRARIWLPLNTVMQAGNMFRETLALPTLAMTAPT